MEICLLPVCVKVATPQQWRDDGAAAEADLRRGWVFGVYICIRRVSCAEVDMGNAALGSRGFGNMDGGVIETEGGRELFHSRLPNH